ncbi:MAG: hypothetical protein ACXV2B_07715 [Halobacteriota archaeon]
MKRMQLIAVALCLIMLTTVGAGVVAAKQTENPRQAGASSIVFYDVAATDAHGTGKLKIDVDKHTFEFNGQGFTPSQQYILQARAASGDAYVFANGKSNPSGNLHLTGTWSTTAAAQPSSPGFGIVAATVYPGTLQRTAGEPCYTLTFTDAYGTNTVKLPADQITYATGGHALPSVIATPVAVDYVYDITSVTYTLSFSYQGVPYTAHWYTSCPYETIVPKLTGTYKPIFVHDSSQNWNEWKWYVQGSLTWNMPSKGPYPVKAELTLYYTSSRGSTFLIGTSVQYPYLDHPIDPPLNIDSSHLSTGCGYCNCNFPLCDNPYNYAPYTATGTVWDSWGNAHTVTATLTPA